MKIEDIIRTNEPDVYAELQHDRSRLTCFFERVEEMLDPIVEFMMKINT